MSSIGISDLKKSYIDRGGKRQQVLTGVELSLDDGDMCAITGPSGSGKTTLLNLIACIDRPDSGHICVNDVELTELDEKKRAIFRNEGVGYIFQEYRLIDSLTVYENVQVPLLLSSRVSMRDMRGLIARAIDMVDMASMAKKSVSRLSGGQRQRVAIARALVMQAQLLIADEPTALLDADGRRDIVNILSGLAQMGKTVIIVTHDAWVSDRCKRVFELQGGKLAQK